MIMNILAFIGAWTILSIVACGIDELFRRKHKKEQKELQNIDLEFKGFESK